MICKRLLDDVPVNELLDVQHVLRLKHMYKIATHGCLRYSCITSILYIYIVYEIIKIAAHNLVIIVR